MTKALLNFLVAEGADRSRHAGGSTLLEHLVGTYEIVRRWNQPVELQHAALLHSVYGTDVYVRSLIPMERRSELIELAGERAERLAYLFSVTPRGPLLAGTYRWMRDLPGVEGEREELDALVLLHMANLAEQQGMSRAWLARLRGLAEVLIDSDFVTLPSFVGRLTGFSSSDEELLRRAYVAGLGELASPEVATRELALAAAICGVVPEPCVWQAYLAGCAGDAQAGRTWAGEARDRLLRFGVPWDKRLTFEEWLGLIRLLEEPRELPPPSDALSEPRALLEAVSSGGMQRPRSGVGGRGRFQRYMESLAAAEQPRALGVYPDLDSRAWYDPAEFPLACYLESHSAEIREEILALDASRFHPESERISRSGDWDVLFLYERGRRHDEVCEACPVTAHGIEKHGAMLTVAGLSYVSRMRGGTHIHAHRGPTNLRLRCHLGIRVPEGDCAIRVSDETRPWTEGKCLVFDDYFEHEAWNHTDDERIVLIVDIWHPSLSPSEVHLLEGLHRYAYTYARQLGRYWAKNAAAAKLSSASRRLGG